MKRITSLLAGVIALIVASCDDNTSYVDLLNRENKSVNRYLVNQRVEATIPPDTIFEVGPDAPYYCLDDEGNIYMQVIDAGSGEKARKDQIVYFRFMRYSLNSYTDAEGLPTGEGNANNLAAESTSFRFENFELPNSSRYGTGIQMPLNFLPLNCQVKLIIKSQYGWPEEMSYVIPFLYEIRYYPSQI